jgi:hypothetical protein
VTTAQRVARSGVHGLRPGAERLDGQPDDGDGRLLVRSYLLEYEPTYLHSLLESVQLFGKDGLTGLPPATFEYSEVDGALSVPELGRLSDEVLPLAGSPADSLGDGRRDLLDVDAAGCPMSRDRPKPRVGHEVLPEPGRGILVRAGMAGASGLYLHNTNVHLLDLDGDGHVG